jgi:prepilin-type N-terminal cleavage/methylation domain-containing protein
MRLTIDARRDAGLTLIEMLVVIVILGVIVVPLASALIAFSRNTDTTTERMALSHDAQLVAAYFARDVSAAGVRDFASGLDADLDIRFAFAVQKSAAYNEGGRTCGTAATPTAVVRFLSDDWSSSGGTPTVSTDIVAYYLETSGTVRALHRLRCAGGSTLDIIVAHYVDPQVALKVSCPTDCTATAPPPSQVTLSFTVTQPHAGSYPITVTGQRRQT